MGKMASNISASVALVLFLTLITGGSTSGAPTAYSPAPGGGGTCPVDTLKFGVCAVILGSSPIIGIVTPPGQPCCSLIQGLVDLEAAICLCTAIKANVLGINLDVLVTLNFVLSYCGRDVPSGFQCA